MKDSIYHLLNRGVEKRKVFLNQKDYLRFIHNLYDFNSVENADQSYYRRRQLTDVARPSSEELVNVLCWSLLPNHPHIMAMEKFDGGISLFSKKIFGGYTKYFNKQNKRDGVLLQGRSKIILLTEDKHFLYLPFYVHLNPLDLFQPNWRENGIKDVKKAMQFLENYRWSNYRDIIKIGNGEFSKSSNKKLFFEMFNTNEKRYKKDLTEWLACYEGDFKEFDE
jgi:putative transposase